MDINQHHINRRRESVGNVPKNRTTVLIGVAVSLLIHAIGLWLVIERTQLFVKPSSPSENGQITVSLTPSVPHSPSQQDMQVTTARSSTQSARPSTRKQVIKSSVERSRAPTSITKTTPSLPQEDTAQRNLPSSEDMFTQLEAARKRRAEARDQAGMPEREPTPSAHEEAGNDNSIALANIATSVNQAKRKSQSDSGGVFQVRHIGYRNAEVFFRGWSTSSTRDRTRLIEVEQGGDADIQIAIVKKMIELIREEKEGDFIWESHRLGRQITLSARLQDSAELQQFLLREFFSDYHPVVKG